jgi:uncharacterized protein (TIGR02001 family)
LGASDFAIKFMVNKVSKGYYVAIFIGPYPLFFICYFLGCCMRFCFPNISFTTYFSKLPLITGCFLTLTGFSSLSNADFKLDVGAASEYVRDGIKQSSARPVLQLGGLYTSQTGLYGGLWMSGVERGNKDSTRFELDGYAGFYLPLNSFMAVDIGINRATFLGDAQASKEAYNEGFFNLLLFDATTFGYRLADDYMGNGESLQRLELAHVINAGSFGFEMSARQYRYLKLSEDANWGGQNRDDYFHFKLGVVRNYGPHNLALSLEKTNLSSQFDGNTQLVFTYNRSFDF